MFTLTVKSGFSAAHHLATYPGACKRIHGHNYKVSISVQACELGESGMIMDLIQLQSLLHECLKPFDHQLLNNIEPFNHLNPTSENIAKTVYEFIQKRLPEHVAMSRVTVHEIDDFCVTYSPH